MTQNPTSGQPARDTSNYATDILKRVDLPISEATGLPNECYLSDTAFAVDRDTIFAPNWACIGFTDQLPEKNYAAPLEFMGLPLLMTRDQNDTIRVFHNVCSHRGMHLADTPCKNNGSVRCPYHNWAYALDGSLISTPHVGGYGIHQHPDFDAAANGLKPIRSTIWLNAIFINLSGDAADFDQVVAPLRQQWQRFTNEKQLARFNVSDDHSRLSLTVSSNWKLAVENYLEAYHLPSVHPELNRISPLAEHYNVEQFEHGGGQVSVNYQRLNIDGTSLPNVDDWPDADANRAEYPVLFPNTFFGVHADQLFVMYLQPLAPDKTTEHVRIFYVDDVGAKDARFSEHRRTTLESWKSVFEEDIFAVERMQKGRNSPAYKGGAFSPEMDESTHHFHKWVARLLTN